mmetsp:Transcript_61015/g.169166  ORF Transcript_61015/g.169166 Transcript_61015/m.169166 type:complete len:433 (-) Transcript_61015:90-1388(-)
MADAQTGESTSAKQTAAEREKRKTLHGEWRTPMPIVFIDDEERSVEGKRCYRGAERDNIRMNVERVQKKVGDQVKIERHITLEWYGDKEDGSVDLENLKFTMTGRANVRYDKIKWDNGCAWTRFGASEREKDDLKHGRTDASGGKKFQAEAQHSAPPPDFCTQAFPQKSLRREAAHLAPRPDWETQVAEVRKVMVQQLQEVEAKLVPRVFAPEAIHLAPPPAQDGAEADCAPPPPPQQGGEDTEEAAPAKVLAPEGLHGMMCCCGSKPQVLEEEPEEQPQEPLPEARDMAEGFFAPDQVEDIVDRINDVVGLWGVSEATEREFLKPPVVAMNKLVKAAMETFMNNPLMDLLSYLMDEAMDFGVKCQAIGRYINEQFIQPLCSSLVEGLTEGFQAIEWIKDQVSKVIMMVASMVTDHVVTKTVETLNESDYVD